MDTQLTSNAEALRLFFTEEIYLVAESKLNDKMSGTIDTAPPIMEEVVVAEAKPKTDFTFLGKNQKNILILVNDAENKVSTEKGRELLGNLMKAINLTSNDVALVNYANYISEKYEDLSTYFSCKLMISFGVSAADLGLPNQPLNQLISHQGTTHIFAKNLNDLEVDKASKKILWASLQQLKV